jgi:hypothetical protein
VKDADVDVVVDDLDGEDRRLECHLGGGGRGEHRSDGESVVEKEM